MAKKNKKNIQKLLAKKRQIQQLGSKSVLPELPNHLTSEPTPTALPVTKTTPILLGENTHLKELKRTIISILVIALLLAAVVIFDQNNNLLDQFGNQLYNGLRLNN